ncbi:MAG: BREX system P-loop protein BrxC [Salibacteraceae bacterium]
MKNSELFVLNPSENNLLNDGVVNINTAHDDNGLRTIKHELKTFVCEGEYEEGINRILSTYLRYIDEPKQPAVWVSGFFGSGKSHLIKMLKYYWENFDFGNGQTARNIKELPFSVRENLTELDRKQSIHGQLAISGTLKDFPSKDIRYSFLQLMLDSLGLPQQYHLFKFVYWAKTEGIYDALVAAVENQGKKFENEIQSLFVSPILARTVLELKPDFALNEGQVREIFKAQFQRVDYIDRKQLIYTIKDEILPFYYGDKIPCTVVVLDEVQQFIGQDQSKTIDIQNLAQDVCDNFDGKLLLIGSGQSALSDTPQLSPLQDRFSVKVSLTDTDVAKVTRKTVLEKKPSVIQKVESQLEKSLGEISRNLTGTSFGYTTADRANLTADYPILPSTRKFWTKIIKVIDKAGTSGQLRSQLRIVDESVKHAAEKLLGNVVPGDFIFKQKQTQLTQNSLLLNETNSLIEERLAQKNTDAEKFLEGRILSVVFLINQLPDDLPGGGLTSDSQTIADLLVSDLNSSSEEFRLAVNKATERLVDEKLLMPIGNEYKLQTKVGAEWEQEYASHVIKLNNAGDDTINRIRQENFIRILTANSKGLNILHGVSKQKRDFELWERTEHPDTSTKLHIWVRDGWNERESILLEEIRAEGMDTPLGYLYIPRERDIDLKIEVIKFLSAKRTIEAKGLQNSLEGEQALKSMETRMKLAEKAMQELSERIAGESKVYLAGGALYDNGTLMDNIKEALQAIADRQFPEFKSKGDFRGWDKALNKATRKAPDALKEIRFDGDPKDHPVSVEILRYIGTSSKLGRDIRNHFSKAPYGWSQDCIDAILITLTITEILSTEEPELRTGTINQAAFRKETHTLSAGEKIKLRKLYLDGSLHCKPGEELLISTTYINQLISLADNVSGEPPLPKPINTTFLKEILHLEGNERLTELLRAENNLKSLQSEWSAKVELLKDRRPDWILIEQLSENLPESEQELNQECDAIRENRLLFQEPDPVKPILNRVTEVLNTYLNKVIQEFLDKYEIKMAELQENTQFSSLSPDAKHQILLNHRLLHKHEVKTLEAEKLGNHLRKLSLDSWRTKISALDGQFQDAMEEAVKLAQPKAAVYTLPKRTLESESDIDAYTDSIKQELKQLIKESGSVILK